MNHLPIIIKPSANHTASLIFLHGFGDTGHGWASTFRQFKKPHIKYVFPTAPIRPITLYNGEELNAWFDKLEKDIVSGADIKTLEESSNYVESLVQEEIQSGIPSEKVFLGGFSQGGACALYALLTKPLKLGGVIALSTYFPQMNGIHQSKLMNKNYEVPILQCHGTIDTIVTEKIGKKTCEFIRNQGFSKVQYNKYEGLDHSSTSEEIDDINDFLNSLSN